MRPIYGVVVTPRYLPSREQVERMLPSGGYLRSILYTVRDAEAVAAVAPPNVGLILLVNNECAEVGFDWSGFEGALRRLVSLPVAERIAAVECGNELDSWYYGGDPNVGPEFAAELVRRARPILEPAGIATLLTPVASQHWGDYLRRACNLARGWYDGVGLHPYGQVPETYTADGWGEGSLRAAVAQAYEIAQAPVWVTEWGIKLSDAGGEDGQARYLASGYETFARLGPGVVPAACYFAWEDRVGRLDERGEHGFGLVRTDGTPRPAFAKLAALAAPAEPAPPTGKPEFILGVRAKAEELGLDVVGEPVEHEHTTSHNGHTISHQLTTRGEFVYWPELGRVDFFEGARAE